MQITTSLEDFTVLESKNVFHKHILALCSVVLIFSIIYGSSACFAANPRSVNPDPLQEALEGIEVLFRMLPREGHDRVDEFMGRLEGKWNVDEEDRGFGAKRVNLLRGFGYIQTYVHMVTFNGRISFFELGLFKPPVDDWALVRKPILGKLQKYKGRPFKEEEQELYIKYTYSGVLEPFYKSVADKLGPIKPLHVPSKLKAAYDYLISPMNNSEVGDGMCFLGPVVEGKTSIDLLIKARRVDLVQNVLRGYNPGGRIYAAIALLRMERKGLFIRPETMKTIEQVASLNTLITACVGCFSRTSVGKDVIEAFVKGSPREFVGIK
jgi:hypothetical protein